MGEMKKAIIIITSKQRESDSILDKTHGVRQVKKKCRNNKYKQVCKELIREEHLFTLGIIIQQKEFSI